MNNKIQIILLLSIVIAANSLNLHPVIGIFTQPSEYKGFDGSQYSYIASSYV